MDDSERLARQFETHRKRLRLISYRMLGSFNEADDAVQEAWLRLSRTGPGGIENLAGWLTTVVSRVCLTMLQSRSRQREDSLDELLLDSIIEPAEGVDPVEEAVLADSVGRALIVVLNRLSPAERVAFVLHDMFAVPFDEIAPMVGRSDAAVRQLASRARRRVRAGVPQPVHDLALQRAVVDAFFAAARLGDLAALIATLDPDVVLRTDQDTASDPSAVIRGAREVAERAVMFANPQRHLKPTLVNGAVGVLVILGDRLVSIMRFIVHEDKVVVIEAFLDPDRLKRVHLSAANE